MTKEDKRKLLDLTIETIKEGKNVLVIQQMYDSASQLRNIENILEEDGDKLSVQSIKRIVDITKHIIHESRKKVENNMPNEMYVFGPGA